MSKIFSLTSFNPAKAQFKDLPPEFGDINYMLNNDDSIFVIQSNRCSSVPVNRNLITDGGGSEALVAARQVLGTERYYAGNYGCDNNPESVCDIGNTVYFASKSNRQVYKFSPSSGIQVISDINMKSYFKSLFEQAEQDRENGAGPIRVVGGYDPYNDTYILSVYNYNTSEGTCGDNSFVDDSGDGEVVTETIVERVYPDSVTMDLDTVVQDISNGQLFAIAGDGFGPDGSTVVGLGELLNLLVSYGTVVQDPGPQTYGADEGGVTFNFPEDEEYG